MEKKKIEHWMLEVAEVCVCVCWTAVARKKWVGRVGKKFKLLCWSTGVILYGCQQSIYVECYTHFQ